MKQPPKGGPYAGPVSLQTTADETCSMPRPTHPAFLAAPQAYLLFGDEQFLRMFADAYASAVGTMQLIGEYSQLRWLVDVHAGSGRISRVWISSLAAFWPGMQALIGVPRPVAA